MTWSCLQQLQKRPFPLRSQQHCPAAKGCDVYPLLEGAPVCM